MRAHDIHACAAAVVAICGESADFTVFALPKLGVRAHGASHGITHSHRTQA